MNRTGFAPWMRLLGLVLPLAATLSHPCEGWSQGAPAPRPGSADLVLLDGHIVTVDEGRPTAQAVACRADRIVAVGTSEEIRRWIGPATRTLDLHGATVVPGFIESHGHFVGLGQSKMILDLTQVGSWSDIVELVRAEAEKTPAGTWIVGRGWHQSKWKRAPEPSVEGYPVHEALSRATPRHPVLLVHASGHMSFANAEAMRIAGVDAETEDPAGGEILRDADGRPTGVFRENAQSLVRYHRQSPVERARELDRAIELATQECLENGVTSFQDAGSSLEVVDRLRELAERRRLGVRLWVMLREGNGRLATSLPRYRMIDAGDHFLTVRAIKRSLDGALGAHGAWLLEPYSDLPESRGLQTISLDSLRETAEIAARHDMQLCVHAIGDRANRETLNVFESVLRRHGSPESRRWRVEHAQHLHPADIPRFAQLGVIAAMQAIHCTSDAVFVPDRLGARRSEEGAYVWQSLLKSGAIVCNGTDAPVENINPLACFHAAVTRRLPDGSVFFPDQRMTREQALRSYTLDAAYAAFEERDKGSLSPGKLADMVVLSRDILRCDEEELKKTTVLHTVLGGKIVYSK